MGTNKGREEMKGLLFTHDEINKILKVLSDWGKPKDSYDGFWFGYSGLEDKTGISIKKLKPIMKYLKNMGICRYQETYDSDYIISGKGYFLNEKYFNKSWEEVIERKVLESIIDECRNSIAYEKADKKMYKQQRDEAISELIEAHHTICNLCVRLNPQHKNCIFCDDVSSMQTIIALSGQTWEEIKAGKI